MSTDVSEVRDASIIRAIIVLMMEAAHTSETAVDIQLRTRQYIPEDSELLTSCFLKISSNTLNFNVWLQNDPLSMLLTKIE
jgi:hypothetical protein